MSLAIAIVVLLLILVIAGVGAWYYLGGSGSSSSSLPSGSMSASSSSGASAPAASSSSSAPASGATSSPAPASSPASSSPSVAAPVLDMSHTYGFQGDNGKWLARCNGCMNAPGKPNSIMVHAGDAWYTKLVPNSDGSVGLQTDDGGFFGVCAGCAPGAINDTIKKNIVLDDMDPTQPTAKWIVQAVPGTNKVAFKNVGTGLYLSRCNSCVSGAAYPDQVAAHAPDFSGAFSQWTPRALN